MEKISKVVEGDFIGTRKAAEMLSVSLRTIQLWVEKGTLKAWKTEGGHRRIELASIEKILKQRQSSLSHKEDKSSLNITIVEDKPELLEQYRLKLESSGLPVKIKTISNAFEGLMDISQNRPDILITDLLMPDIDSVEMIKYLNNNHKLDNSDVIVITNLKNEELNKRGAMPDNIQLMEKPLHFDHLESIIRNKVTELQH